MGAEPTKAGLGRHALLAVSSVVANLLGYGFSAIASRQLGASGFGVLSSLLALLIIAQIPGIAVQTVAARRVAADGGRPPNLWRPAAIVGAVQVLVLAALTPVVSAAVPALDPVQVLLLALGLLPATIGTFALGALQGASLFGRFGILLLVTSGARLLFGGLGGLTGNTTLTVAAISVAACAAAVVGWMLLPGAVSGLADSVTEVLRETGLAGIGVGGVIVLGNIDVVLAGRFLHGAELGLYGAGALFAKAAYWGPQFILFAVFPTMAAAERGRVRALLGAAGLLTGIGIVAMTFTALTGRWLVSLVAGPEYEATGRWLWVFVATGIAVATLHLLLLHGLAARAAATTAVLAGTVLTAVAITLVTTPDTVGQLIGTMAAVAWTGCLVAAVVAVRLARRRPPGDPAVPSPDAVPPPVPPPASSSPATG